MKFRHYSRLVLSWAQLVTSQDQAEGRGEGEIGPGFEADGGADWLFCVLYGRSREPV